MSSLLQDMEIKGQVLSDFMPTSPDVHRKEKAKYCRKTNPANQELTLTSGHLYGTLGLQMQ